MSTKMLIELRAIGPSGCGKTRTLNVLIDVLKLSGAEVVETRHERTDYGTAIEVVRVRVPATGIGGVLADIANLKDPA